MSKNLRPQLIVYEMFNSKGAQACRAKNSPQSVFLCGTVSCRMTFYLIDSMDLFMPIISALKTKQFKS